ncbi:unnamed protein product, partial [Ectocarpus sp. 12 AP-2014]
MTTTLSNCLRPQASRRPAWRRPFSEAARRKARRAAGGAASAVPRGVRQGHCLHHRRRRRHFRPDVKRRPCRGRRRRRLPRQGPRLDRRGGRPRRPSPT